MIKFGTVASASLCAPIDGVTIKALLSGGKVAAETVSSSNGEWQIDCLPSVEKLYFVREGYLPKAIELPDNTGLKVRLLEDSLIGYQEKLWAVPGEKISVYVNSCESYSAEILRHGIRTQRIMGFGPFDSCLQVVPDDNFVDKGLSWKESFSYVVPADALPGIYSLRLIQRGASARYGITFVVSMPREDSPRQLLVLASTNTWQSYNLWGGRSRYRNNETPAPLRGAGVRQTINKIARSVLRPGVRSFIKTRLGMKEPVSYQDCPGDFRFRRLSIRRPFPQCSIMNDDPMDVFSSHLAPAEWRLLAWLEREQFQYDLVSGWEFSRDPEIVFKYPAILLNTHCEYWSRAMYYAVKEFRAKGGWILNLSGNSMFREIECEEDGSTRCVSLSLKESVDDESALLGVRFDMRGYRTCAPFRVTNDSHWVFHGTGLKNGDLFSMNSLNHPENGTGCGGSGHETDKLTSSAPLEAVLLAKGCNPNNGGADMIMIEENKLEGGMFSASSITFGGSLLVDHESSIIVRNVLSNALGSKRFNRLAND